MAGDEVSELGAHAVLVIPDLFAVEDVLRIVIDELRSAVRPRATVSALTLPTREGALERGRAARVKSSREAVPPPGLVGCSRDHLACEPSLHDEPCEGFFTAEEHVTAVVEAGIAQVELGQRRPRVGGGEGERERERGEEEAHGRHRVAVPGVP